MRTVALLMAGGRGMRMRASGEMRPKPLVQVAGATLLERNLFLLLNAGFHEVLVSVPAGIPEVGAVARTRLRRLVDAASGRLDVLEETTPLGNIGCAAVLEGAADAVLVVYADNLTTLNLGAVVDRHVTSGAAYTLAVHEHRYRLPYGEITVEGGDIVDYREKPEWRPLVCSAVSVLGPPALAVLGGLVGRPPVSPAGLVDLFHAVRHEGGKVVAFEHEAPWVDVNEAETVPSAEAIVAADAERCERWWPDGVNEMVARVAAAGTGRVVIDDVDDFGGDSCVPVRYVVSAEAAAPPAPAIVAARAAFHLGRRDG